MTPRYHNVFEAIAREGHEESFVPVETDEFEATDLAAGSREKIELLRRRVELGVAIGTTRIARITTVWSARYGRACDWQPAID